MRLICCYLEHILYFMQHTNLSGIAGKFALIFLVLLAVLSFKPLGAKAVSPEELGLKEGDLISSFVYDKDPDIFIINQDGFKRLFLNQAIFKFYGHLRYISVKLVKPEVKDQFITASFYRNCENNDPKVYGLETTGEDTGALHHLNVDGSAAVSQDRDFFKKVFCINGREFKWYQRGDAYPSLNKVPSYKRGIPTKVSTLYLDPSSLKLTVGAAAQVKVMFRPPHPECLDSNPPCEVPEIAPYEVVPLFTYDPSVATVDTVIRDCAPSSPGINNLCLPQYFVRGIAAGNAIITASYTNSEGTFTATMNATVVGQPSSRGTLSIVPPSANLTVGERVFVQAYFQQPLPACLKANPPCLLGMPEPAPERVYAFFTSDNPSVAAVDKTEDKTCDPPRMCPVSLPQYAIRGVSAGSAVMTATYTSGSDTYTAQMKASVISQGAQNLPPVISGIKGPTTLKVGETGTWTLQASDPENGSLSYRILWGDEATTPTPSPAPAANKDVTQTATFTHAYAKAGTFTPTFTVTDDAGLSAKTSASVNVGESTPSANHAPQINGIPPIPNNIQPGQEVSFTWSATDADNDLLAWSVDWGDGVGIGAACPILQITPDVGTTPSKPVSPPSGRTFTQTHAWQKAGSYKAVATVIDCKGGSDSNGFIIKVGDASSPSVTVLSPNGGEKWQVGSTQTIQWTTTNINSKTGLIDVIRLRDSSGQEINLLTNTPNDGSEQIIVPSLASGFYTLEIKTYSDILGYAVSDASDAPFSIVSSIPTLSVALDSSTPIGSGVAPGQTNVPFAKIKFSAGSADVSNLNAIHAIQIASDSPNAASNVVNARVYDGATPVGSIVFSLTFNGDYYYGWANLTSPFAIPAHTSKVFTLTADVPNSATGSVRLGIAGLTFNAPGAIATGLPVYGSPISIVPSSSTMTVLSPNGGETLVKGKPVAISWAGGYSKILDQNGVALQLQRSDGNQFGWISFGNAPSGSFTWDPSKVMSARGFPYNVDVPDGKYRIYAIDYNSSNWQGPGVNNTDQSDGMFTITS